MSLINLVSFEFCSLCQSFFLFALFSCYFLNFSKKRKSLPSKLIVGASFAINVLILYVKFSIFKNFLFILIDQRVSEAVSLAAQTNTLNNLKCHICGNLLNFKFRATNENNNMRVEKK